MRQEQKRCVNKQPYSVNGVTFRSIYEFYENATCCKMIFTDLLIQSRFLHARTSSYTSKCWALESSQITLNLVGGKVQSIYIHYFSHEQDHQYYYECYVTIYESDQLIVFDQYMLVNTICVTEIISDGEEKQVLIH